MTELPRITVPDRRDYDPAMGATFLTGAFAQRSFGGSKVTEGAEYTGGPVAIDIETPGLHDPFTIKCVTACWRNGSGLHVVLLDPARNPRDAEAVREITSRADELVLHNASFDVPGLVLAQLLTLDDIGKITDTLVYARMRWTDTLAKKNLETLAVRLLGLRELEGGLKIAMKAAGFKSNAQWFAEADIDRPTYRFGAMADTVVTLRVLEPLRASLTEYLTDHPFETYGITDPVEAMARAEQEQRVNRIMLRRSAVGLAVDREYLDRYREEVETEVLRAEHLLRQHDIDPGNGKHLVAKLDELGQLPGSWPRTKTGLLSSAKDHLEELAHPLADAHREVAHAGKIVGYLEAVAARSRVSGRLHPQVGVLGASQTGRMAYSDPPLQQFAAEARPIICDDGQGMVSIDWSQIEPVTLANMAGDTAFLAPFESGADLYEPIQLAAGVDRKVAKVVLLGTMYGQGETKLAATIAHTVESAAQIKRQMFSAMPESAKFMGRITSVAEQFGKVVTVSGRILSVPEFNGQRAGYKSVNHTIQGSAYDVLSDTIIRADDAGISQHIQLAMHDEIVCDKEAAEEMRRIMMTPPESLVRWAGRTPVFRTDMADLGHAWAYV